eukprot:CAMPEP_0202943508 /NCGR_PEP_ID=MMETSP1395-20130829/3968_1 /ASSEMBLY_ACC=CAM_ASM_000871 /TAXON_ID=5961 /ORGANISM="Blepharisma japonicum, Strain Stock R1072" /LENGTH=62 /DNA_ID=CAMNT_0049641059 /DNA_START=66 /DNA_END=254 /DNA_ORIENTATION=+
MITTSLWWNGSLANATQGNALSTTSIATSISMDSGLRDGQELTQKAVEAIIHSKSLKRPQNP